VKLIIQSAMIFFGTLMAAGVVALGEPASHGHGHAMQHATAFQALDRVAQFARPGVDTVSAQRGTEGRHE